MRKSDLLNLAAEFKTLSHEDPPVIVGSQAFHAITNLLPEIARKSVECDFLLSGSNFARRAQIDESLGVFSEFQIEHGFYADALGLATVVLPEGWRERLLPLLDESGNVAAFCAEPHDVCVSKLVAGRDKDLEFLESALASDLIDMSKILERLAMVGDKVENGVLTDRLTRLSKVLISRKIHRESVDLILAFLGK